MDRAPSAYKSWEPHPYFYFPLSTEDSMQFVTKANQEENRGMLGAYDGADKFLCAAPRIEGILDVLRGMEYRGLVRIATAPSLPLLQRLTWDRQVADAESIIKAAVTKRDESALRIFRSAVRATGVKRGPRRSEEYNRARIEELRLEMEGAPHKTIAKEARQATAVSTRLGRFCEEIRVHYALMGAPDISCGCDERFASWFTKKLSFRLPDELPIIRHALSRRTRRA